MIGFRRNFIFAEKMLTSAMTLFTTLPLLAKSFQTPLGTYVQNFRKFQEETLKLQHFEVCLETGPMTSLLNLKPS